MIGNSINSFLFYFSIGILFCNNLHIYITMGNSVLSKVPITTIKELYTFTSIELFNYQQKLEGQIPPTINKSLYLKYSSYTNKLLSIQSDIQNHISDKDFLEVNTLLRNIKNKYEDSYKNYEYQRNRRQDYTQELIDFNCSRIDSLMIFNLNEQFSMNELKLSYRQLAKKYHPDKNKQPKASDKFKLITKAYMSLLEELKLKESDKPFYRLKEESNTCMDQHNSQSKKNIKLNGKFDSKLFNTLYEDNRLYDPNDEGYNMFLKNTHSEKQIIDDPKVFSDNFNINVFNELFEKHADRKAQVVKYNVPLEHNSNQYSLIGTDTIDNFSIGINNGSDIRESFTIPLISNNTSNRINTLEEFKNERSNIYNTINEPDMNYNIFIDNRNTLEEQRLKKVSHNDNRAYNNFNTMNKVMIDNQLLSRE